MEIFWDREKSKPSSSPKFKVAMEQGLKWDWHFADSENVPGLLAPCNTPVQPKTKARTPLQELKCNIADKKEKMAQYSLVTPTTPKQRTPMRLKYKSKRRSIGRDEGDGCSPGIWDSIHLNTIIYQKVNAILVKAKQEHESVLRKKEHEISHLKELLKVEQGRKNEQEQGNEPFLEAISQSLPEIEVKKSSSTESGGAQSSDSKPSQEEKSTQCPDGPVLTLSSSINHTNMKYEEVSEHSVSGQSKTSDSVVNPPESSTDPVVSYVQGVVLAAQTKLQVEQLMGADFKSEARDLQTYQHWLEAAQRIITEQEQELVMYRDVIQQLDLQETLKTDAEDALEQVAGKLKEKTEQLTAREKSLDVKTKEVESLENQCKQTILENERLQKSYAELQSEVADLVQQLADQQVALDQQKEDTRGLRQALEDQEWTNQEEIMGLKQCLEDKETDYKVAISALREELQELGKKNAELNCLVVEQEDLQEASSLVEQQLKREIDNCKIFIKEKEEEIKGLRAEVEKHRAALRRSNHRCTSHEMTIGQLRDQVEKLEYQKGAMEQLLDHRNQEIKDTLQSVQELSTRMMALLDDMNQRETNWVVQSQGAVAEVPVDKDSDLVTESVENLKPEAHKTTSMTYAAKPQGDIDMTPALLVRGSRQRQSFVCSVMRAVSGVTSNENTPVTKKDVDETSSGVSSVCDLDEIPEKDNGSLFLPADALDCIPSPIKHESERTADSISKLHSKFLESGVPGSALRKKPEITDNSSSDEQGSGTHPANKVQFAEWPVAQPVTRSSCSSAFIRVLKTCEENTAKPTDNNENMKSGRGQQEQKRQRSSNFDPVDMDLTLECLGSDDTRNETDGSSKVTQDLNQKVSQLNSVLSLLIQSLKNIEQGALRKIDTLQLQIAKMEEIEEEKSRQHQKETRLQKHEIDLLKKEIVCLERMQKKLQEELRQKQTTLAEKESSLNKMKEQIRGLVERLETTSDQSRIIKSLEKQVAEMRRQTRQDVTRLEVLEQLERMGRSGKKKDQQMAMLVSHSSQLKQQLLELTDKMESNDKEHSMKLSALVAEKADLQKQVDALTQQIQAGGQSDLEINKEISMVKGELHLANSQIEQLVTVIDRTMETFSKHKDTVTSHPDLASVAKQLEASREDLRVETLSGYTLCNVGSRPHIHKKPRPKSTIV